MGLLDSLFRVDEVEAALGDAARVQAMLDFEAALARAEAVCGLIPAAAATTISGKCRAELFDFAALQTGAANAGNLAIPLVQQLTALVAGDDAAAADFVHWGATSQDAIDTGFSLQLRVVLKLMLSEVRELCGHLAKLADGHRATVMVGRTWLQHAAPTTFGVKVAGWLDALLRHWERLSRLRENAAVLQFGGAVGTLSSLGPAADAVSAALGKELALGLPAMPWHSQRDRIAEVATTMGVLTGTLGKIARDISLHGQTEIGELREPGGVGRGGSSSMPHKRNPVSCAVILATTVRMPGLVSGALSAMVQEDERGLGGWHAEWETLPEILGLAAGALRQLNTVAGGLEVDAARMRDNLESTHGLIYAEAVTVALAAKISKREARGSVERACEQAAASGEHLREVLRQNSTVAKHLSPEDLTRIFDPRQHLGISSGSIDRVLTAAKTLVANSGPKTN